MSAYLIFVLRELHDRKGLEEYWAKIGATLAGTQARNLAAYTTVETLEGNAAPALVVTEFPSVEAAKSWYDGPAYKAIRHLRHNAADYDGYLVDGGVVPAAERLLGLVPAPKGGASGHEPGADNTTAGVIGRRVPRARRPRT